MQSSPHGVLERDGGLIMGNKDMLPDFWERSYAPPLDGSLKRETGRIQLWRGPWMLYADCNGTLSLLMHMGKTQEFSISSAVAYDKLYLSLS